MATASELGYKLGKKAGLLDSITKTTGGGTQKLLNLLSGRERWGTKLVEHLGRPSARASAFTNTGAMVHPSSKGVVPTSIDPATRANRLQALSANSGMESGRANLGAGVAVGIPTAMLLNNYLNSAEDSKLPPKTMYPG